jgi:hypothetical protein
MSKTDSGGWQRAKQPVLVAGTALCIALLIWQFAPRGVAVVTAGDGYFSADDGKTFFVAASDQLPPFTHDGRDAVAARVYSCGAQPPFVGYLERYTDAGKARAKELLAERAAGKDSRGADAVLMANMELKRPGEAKWVRASDPSAIDIRKVMCPGDPTRPASVYAPPAR